jgi:hypothetical protein
VDEDQRGGDVDGSGGGSAGLDAGEPLNRLRYTDGVEAAFAAIECHVANHLVGNAVGASTKRRV